MISTVYIFYKRVLKIYKLPRNTIGLCFFLKLKFVMHMIQKLQKSIYTDKDI